MITGSERTNFADKRNLPQQRLKDTFFDYLAESLLDITKRAWQSERGVFGVASLTGGTDVLSVGTLPVELLDGDGYIMELDGADGTNLAFENAAAATYYVGCRHCLIPSGVERNPRNDVINYDVWVDSIGESGTPNTVAEVAGQLQINVNNVFEAGVDHSGRLVTVYMNRARTTDASVAIERNLVVSYVAGNNTVTTTGLLGQASGSASTLVADYTVVAQGATIRKNTNLQTTSPYAFIGTATGSGSPGVPTTSTVGQIDVTNGINPTLDEAYNNSGAGKRISIDDGAVELETTGSSPGDHQNAQFRLRRYGSVDWAQFQLVLEIGDYSAIPIAILQSARPAGGTVSETEPVTISGNTLTFTGGGVDLTDTDLRLSPKLHLIYLQVASTPSEQQPLTIIPGTITATTVQVKTLSGVTPTFASTSGTVRILVPKFVAANVWPHPDTSGSDVLKWWGGITNVLRDGQGNANRFRIIPDGAYGNLVELFDTEDTPGYWARFNLGAKGSDEGVFEFNRRMTIKESYGDSVHGLLVEGGGLITPVQTDVQPVSLAVKSFLGGPYADEFNIGLNGGTVVRATNFRDDFHYEDWNSIATRPKRYEAGADGLGDIFMAWDDAGIILETGISSGNMTWLNGARKLHIGNDQGYRWTWQAIVALKQGDDANNMIQVGLRATKFPTGNFEWYFQRMAAVSGGYWEFKGSDAGAGFAVNTGVDCIDGEWYFLRIDLFYNDVFYYVGRLGYNTTPNAMTGPGSRALDFSVHAANELVYPECRIRTDEADYNRMYLLYWEWWQRDGPFHYTAGLSPRTPAGT